MSSEIVWLLFILSSKLNIVARSQQADSASFIQTKINLFWTFLNKKLCSIIRKKNSIGKKRNWTCPRKSTVQMLGLKN
jgi:hypothetical protein